jgi:hypothetical protein
MHIDPGQQPATPGAGAIAQHQPGEDRQASAASRGEGQQQAKAEERQQAPGQVALLQAMARAWSLACSAAGVTLPPRSISVVCGG